VEYADWAPPSLAWEISEQPLLQIGALEGEEPYQFDEIGGVTKLSDGRIVAVNEGTQELRFFDPTGRHLLTAGRKGEGPGEFTGLGPLVRAAGDTLFAYDWNQRRISVFDPTGGFVRSVTLQFAEGSPAPAGRFANGSWLSLQGFVFAPGAPGTDVVRDTSSLLVFGPDGTVADSVGPYIGPDYYVRSEGQAAFASSLPFGRMTEVAVAGNRFYAGYTEHYEIVRRDATGNPDLVIRAARAPAPLTAALVEAHKAERLAEADDRWRPRLERLYQDIPFPETLPAFTDLQVDADGNLWVLDVSPPTDTRRVWTVFAPNGDMLGRLETPADVSVREIGHDYLLGTWSDDFDVPYVRLYRLERGAER
jgi:hypothetical protein